MGFFRFHRSTRLAPGVRLNFSRSGPSLSIGAPGATLNVGHGQARYTASIPGTGLSCIERQRVRKTSSAGSDSAASCQTDASMAALARSLSDDELEHHLKKALADAHAATEGLAGLKADDRETALWQANILREELARREHAAGYVPKPYDEDTNERAYAGALQQDERQASRQARPHRSTSPVKLMVLLGGFLAGWRLGKRL